jgi:hypothetical protein
VITILDLIAYASAQARIEARSYFDPRYARPDEVRAWRNDRGHRDRDRRRVFRTFANRLKSSEPLIPGHYGRLEITDSAIDYTPGMYAPREIWPAVLNYLTQTN